MGTPSAQQGDGVTMALSPPRLLISYQYLRMTQTFNRELENETENKKSRAERRVGREP